MPSISSNKKDQPRRNHHNEQPRRNHPNDQPRHDYPNELPRRDHPNDHPQSRCMTCQRATNDLLIPVTPLNPPLHPNTLDLLTPSSEYDFDQTKPHITSTTSSDSGVLFDYEQSWIGVYSALSSRQHSNSSRLGFLIIFYRFDLGCFWFQILIRLGIILERCSKIKSESVLSVPSHIELCKQTSSDNSKRATVYDNVK